MESDSPSRRKLRVSQVGGGMHHQRDLHLQCGPQRGWCGELRKVAKLKSWAPESRVPEVSWLTIWKLQFSSGL